jgi:hypothetical protein
MQSVKTLNKAHLDLIRRYGNLFWYIPEEEKENISMAVLVETILNYGDLEAVRRLIDIAGINSVADIFFRQTANKRVNYYPQVSNFFTLYFNRHAPGSSDSAAI